MSNSIPLAIATGNASKFYEATEIFKLLDVAIEQTPVDIDEIQHHDPIKIVESKVKSAYDVLKRPVAVNDSFWDIPALGGFPGGYMKDVSEWLSTQDFMNLMKDKDDKRIILHECMGFYDGETLKLFLHDRPAHFVDQARGESPPSFGRIVQLDDEDRTISQMFDMKQWPVNPERHKHWHDLAEWYVNEYLVT